MIPTACRQIFCSMGRTSVYQCTDRVPTSVLRFTDIYRQRHLRGGGHYRQRSGEFSASVLHSPDMGPAVSDSTPAVSRHEWCTVPTASRQIPGSFPTSSRHLVCIYRHLPAVSRRLPDILPTFYRHLPTFTDMGFCAIFACRGIR